MMDQVKIDVSVITPFYRGNSFLENLFRCIRANAQAAAPLHVELVLVNDSPDCPVSYREDWVEGFSLQVLTNPENAGIHQSRINGLKAAKGEFVLFLDQDDLLADDAIISQWRAIRDADLVVANGIDESRDARVPIYQSAAHQRQAAIPRFYFSIGCQIVSPGQCLIRRNCIPDLWRKCSISQNGADDYFLWLLLLKEKIRWKINPCVLYTHVNTGSNVSIDLERMIRSSVEVLELLRERGLLTVHQERTAKRRYQMRRMYEGRGKWRKILACLCYPDLFLELCMYTLIKKF